MNGGSNPAAYEGVTFSVSYSDNGNSWTPLATLFGADISVDNYTRFAYRIPDRNARYVRWKLETSTKGNTRLNNIKITQNSGSDDSTSVSEYHPETFGIFPNPTNAVFHIHQGRAC